MADKLPLVPRPDPITAAQGEGLTRPAQGTNVGDRTTDLNQEFQDSDWFRKLKKKAEEKGWSREELDEEVRKQGIR